MGRPLKYPNYSDPNYQNSTEYLVRKWKKEAEENPHWPLPPNYGALNNDDRKKARVALCRRQDTPEHIVIGWRFFCKHYLAPEESGFYDGYKPPAPFHVCLIHDIAQFPLNMDSCHRDSGKTTTLKSFLLFLGTTRRNFRVIYVKSTKTWAEYDSQDLRFQWENNEAIKRDFGTIKPKRGSGSWSAKMIWTESNFRIQFFAIESAVRGGRPNLAILDDVEFDDEKPERAAELSEITEQKMDNVFIPMMRLDGTSMLFIGTTRPNSYLFRCIRSNDPKFEVWNRRNFQIEKDGVVLWSRYGKAQIQDLKDRIGLEAYSSEYMGDPKQSGSQQFPLNLDYHTYQIADDDGNWNFSPCDSQAVLVRRVRGDKTKGTPDQHIRVPAVDVLAESLRFMTMDFTKSTTRHSDFSGCLVMAADSQANLYLLDIYLARKGKADLFENAIRLAMKWRLKIIFPESVAVQSELPQLIRGALKGEFLKRMGYLPAVIGLQGKAFNESKGNRIDTVQWRFLEDKIFLPAHLLQQRMWRELVNEIRAYNGNPELLPYDDAIDMLGMSTLALKDKRINAKYREPVKNAMQLRLDNPIWKDIGISPLAGIDITHLPAQDVAELERRQAEQKSRHSRRYRLNRSNQPSPEKTEALKEFDTWIRQLSSSPFPLSSSLLRSQP